MAGEEAGFGALEVSMALAGEEAAISTDVVGEHFEAFLEGVADDLAVLDVVAFLEGDAVGQ